MKFAKYKIIKPEYVVETSFVPSDFLPDEIPVSTPFTIPFIDNKIVLALDKSDWWNPLGGHIEDGETWESALSREAEEEAGVMIKDIQIIGYVKAVTVKGESQYPKISILPFTISKVDKVIDEWQIMETSERGFFTQEEAFSLLQKRNDNQQMSEIVNYAFNKYETN